MVFCRRTGNRETNILWFHRLNLLYYQSIIRLAGQRANKDLKKEEIIRKKGQRKYKSGYNNQFFL